jgi:hypothetical protein
MRVTSTDPVALAAPPPTLAKPADPVSPDPVATPSFEQVLRGLGREVGKGESTMRTALQSMRGGANLDPAQLIALQAGVYRYSESIDLTSRLVDRMTSGVKTIVQGGGQ